MWGKKPGQVFYQADVAFGYGYDNLVRDVSGTLSTVVQSMPTLLSIVADDPEPVRNHKHEWPEHTLAPSSTTLTAAVAAADTTAWTVASSAGLQVGTILRVEDSKEIVRVVAIGSATAITVARSYGSSPGAAAIASGKRLTVVSHPRKEATPPQYSSSRGQPTLEYNFTEIIDGEAAVPRSQSNVYGIGSPGGDPVGAMMDFQIEQELRGIGFRQNSALIYGRRVARTPETAGTMGGLLQFHEGGNLVDAQDEVLSEGLLDAAFQKIFEGGGDTVDTLLCGFEISRQITGLYKDRLMILRQDTVGGYQVMQVTSSAPIRGYVSTIVVDPNFPKRAASLFARRNITKAWMRRMRDEDSTVKGADFVSRRIIGEWTAVFRNWKQTACLIDNIALVAP